MRRLLLLVVSAAALAGTLLPWLATATMASTQAKEFTLVNGWYRDREVRYYDFGTNTKLGAGGVETAPIYVFIHGMNADGSPDLVEGQHNIIDVRPGDAGYSDLWQVMLVTVDDGYMPDSIKSKADLDASGLEVTETNMFVNCPVVPAGSTLEGGEPLTQGWYKGEQVFYPDFGMNNRSAIPIWVFIHGMNTDGTPDFVEGQSNIIDQVPGDAGYSAFWQVVMVTVPAGYTPNSIRSADAVRASGLPTTTTDMIVNCPVTTVAAAASAQPPGGASTGVTAPATGTSSAASGGNQLAALMAIGAAGVALAGAGVLAVRRNR